MRQKIVGPVFLLLGLLMWNVATAQKARPFPAEPAAFLPAFTQRIAAERGEAVRQLEAGFSSLWQSGSLSAAEKETFIEQVNIMAERQYKLAPTIANFTRALMLVKTGNNYVKIGAGDFLEVARQSMDHLNEERMNMFFSVLMEYLPEGYPARRRKFSWHASETNPKLILLKMENGPQQYIAPAIHFEQTDLVYRSVRDSAQIASTSGDFNLVARMFMGDGGRVDWSKLGLDPADVFCEFNRYKLNFNYGVIEADSAEFHYKSLIKEPLIGYFTDKNVGFKDPGKANYPYFRSYSGGVVIENFIPHVRYTGGFSLKGTRKIGTAYDLLVDQPYGGYSGDPERYAPDAYLSAEEVNKKYDEDSSDEWSTSGGYEEWDIDDDEFDPFEGSGDYWSEGKVRKHVKAKLEIQRNDVYVTKLQGEAFVLDDEKLVGDNIEATLYLADRDSLYHPSMDLRYRAENRTITLSKSPKSNFKSVPFASSYHDFFLYFETIVWNLETDEIAFTAMIDQENKISAIESYDYFTQARFSQFKNVLKFNPIGAIYRYAMLHPDDPIYPSSIFQEETYRRTGQQDAFERSLPMLEGSGFITYDKKTKRIYPQLKLYNWAKAARGRKDFDAIQLISKVEDGPNAVLDINTKQFRMRGVPYFSLSDSQYVRVVPLDEEVVVDQNRTLRFAGTVATGRLNLYANDEDNRPRFSLDYEGFKIHCDSLDSIRFVLVRSPEPGYELTPMEQALSKTVFENVSGTIHIDHPMNKSGQEDFPEYPIFDSHSYSYIYWDKPYIQQGVYIRDKLYFSVDPFVLDSLENFDRRGLKFDGLFYSDEIFPEFRQQLTVMPDFTLGFVHEVPESGYDVYDYRGRYYGEILIDGSGLYGRGSLEHLDAVVASDSFLFHFDSVMAVVDTFSLPGGYRFPNVEANNIIYTWYTKIEQLQLASREGDPIRMYDGEGTFEGKLRLSREGLVGNGTFSIGELQIDGDSIVFRDRDLEARLSRLAIADSLNPDEIHFRADSVDIRYDIWRRTARFEGRDKGKPQVEFPIHQYLSSLTIGEYDAYEKNLRIRGPSADNRDNFFLSTAADGDSLQFIAREAFYNVESRTIEIEDVPGIFVADAFITSPYSKLTIEENGLIDRLENAVIEINQDSVYRHRIYEASVQILSGTRYEGSGKYDYIKVKGLPQYIEFGEIYVNSDTVSVAAGNIAEDERFYLTDRILFRGNAELVASNKFIYCEGEVKIESENPVFKGAWFPFERSLVNPDSVFIPIPEHLTNENGDLLTAGLNFNPPSRTFYSTFLQAKKDDRDIELITAFGGLTLDRKTQEFRIGSREKIKLQAYRGAVVSFDDVNNIITSKGFLDFDYLFKENTLEMQMAGAWKDNLKTRRISTDLMIGIRANVVPEEQLEKVVTNFRFLTTANRDIDFLQQSMLENAAELLDFGKTGEKETEKYIDAVKDAMVYTDIDLAERLGYTLLLSNVNFDYSPDEKALFCDSEIGLIGLGGKRVNKMVNAKIVYQLGRGIAGEDETDQLTVYLEIDEFNWIFFHYEGDELRTLSSFYDDYNYPLQEYLDKQKSQDAFKLILAGDEEVSNFKQDFVLRFIRKR